MRKIVLAFGLILGIVDFSVAQITSDFNGNDEGWKAPSSFGAAITYTNTGGNPGGFIKASDIPVGAGAVYWYFTAPGTFTGNRSSYYNGILSYDLSESAATTSYVQTADIILTNGTTTIYYFSLAPTFPATYPVWTSYSIPLNELSGKWKTANSSTATAATQAEILSTLSGLNGFSIRGRFGSAPLLSTSLDNVSFTQFSITQQPSSTSVCIGATALLTANATAKGTVSYQWQKFDTSTGGWVNVLNAGAYAGATASTLTINTTGNIGAGTYRCDISSTLGTKDLLSNTANVVINAIPAAPAATGGTACGPASVTLSASGATNGQYRWYTVASGGTSISAQTNSTYTTPVLVTTTTYYVSINNGSCESSRKSVVAIIDPCGNQPPVIASIVSISAPNVSDQISLSPFISDPDNNLDLSTLKIIKSPVSGATASLDVSNSILSLNYEGTSFTGIDTLVIEVCDVLAACTRSKVIIDIVGDIKIYTAISPNGDGKNDYWFIQYIDLFNDTRKNHASIFNRWGDSVFETDDYDNINRVFTGVNKSGGQLPSGTYFFKVEFPSGRKTETGYISLKR